MRVPKTRWAAWGVLCDFGIEADRAFRPVSSFIERFWFGVAAVEVGRTTEQSYPQIPL